MISRRSLLTGFSLLPLAGGIAGCAARASALAAGPAAGGAIPLVGPGTRWNGSPLSGGVPPADPVRTTAKPAILWLIPSDLRLVSNLTIGVDADANGGIKQVDFWVEGQVQTVTAASIYTDTDANGAPRSRYGYWITLNASTFKVISTTGEARIYATAVPNDTTMQSRVIGYDGFTGLDGSYPMSVFPRSVANDWSKTVRLDGTGDYASLSAALAGARAASAEAPLITITQTGAYEVTNAGLAANAYGSGGKGFCTVTAAPGVIATLGRAAAFTPNVPASWTWTPGWEGMEFRGSGIVFDQRNWTLILFNGKPAWMNGCKFTNSIGTVFSYYWNGGLHPGFGSTIPGYWDDVYTEFVALEGALGHQRYTRGCKVNQYAGDVFSGCHYVADNYVYNWSSIPFIGTFQGTTNYTGLRINGPANSTVTKTAGDVQGGNLLLRVSGSTVATIPIGLYGTDTNPTIAAMVTAINAFGSGWSASAQNGRGAMRPSAIGGPTSSSGSTFTDLASSSTLSLNAGFDIHSDWWQGYCGSNTRQNVIIRGNILRAGGGQESSVLNNDDGSNGGHAYDHVVKANVWLGPDGATNAAGGPTYVGGSGASHYVFENNTCHFDFIRVQSSAGDQTYSSFRNNIVGVAKVDTGAPYTWTADTPWINNMYLGSFQGAITGGRNTGNAVYTSALGALFKNFAVGDLTRASVGPLASSLFPRVNAYDGRLLPFAANDIAGAWSMNDPAKTYPF
jgi:hypothetical protein